MQDLTTHNIYRTVVTFQVCTRCHLKQKEEEISTEKALSAIGAAKFGVCKYKKYFGSFFKIKHKLSMQVKM